MAQTALARFRMRVLTILDERGATQKSLKGNKTEGWISNIISGRRNLRLDDAEAIADALQRPLAELLRRPDDQIYELDNLEVRLMEAFRQLTTQEQQAFLLTITLRQRPAPYNASKNIVKYENPSRRSAATHVAPHSKSAPLTSATEQELLAEFERRFHTQPLAGTGEQTATTSGPRAGMPPPRGKVRGSSAK